MIDLLKCILHLREFRHHHLCWGAASARRCQWPGSCRCLHPEHSERLGSIHAPFWQVTGSRAHAQERILGRENTSQQYSDKHKQWQKANNLLESNQKRGFLIFSLGSSQAQHSSPRRGELRYQPMTAHTLHSFQGAVNRSLWSKCCTLPLLLLLGLCQ